MKILVVEDSPQVAETVMDYLELAGHRVDCAYHGQAALQLLAEQRFDVIIMDVMMPRLDGLRTVERLRSDGIATPVLFLTARDSLDDKLAGFKAGGDDYLVKPFAMEELEVRLQALALRGPRSDMGALAFGELPMSLVGASGAVMGLLLAFGVMHPNAVIMLLIPPIPMKAKWFVVVYGVIELFFGISGRMDGVAHFAHVGGMLWGFLLLYYWKHKGVIRY